MNVHEYQAADVLASFGIPVNAGDVAKPHDGPVCALVSDRQTRELLRRLEGASDTDLIVALLALHVVFSALGLPNAYTVN